MPTNYKEFNKKLFRAGLEFPKEQLLQVRRKIVIDFLAKILLKHPVDTGYSRGNWQVSISVPTLEVIEKIRDPSSVSTIELPKLENDTDPFEVVFIVNNVEYVIYLEAGSSKRTGRHFIQASMQEVLASLQ